MHIKSLLLLFFPSGGRRDPLQLHGGAPGHGELRLPSPRLSDKDCGGRALGSHRRGKSGRETTDREGRTNRRKVTYFEGDQNLNFFFFYFDPFPKQGIYTVILTYL